MSSITIPRKSLDPAVPPWMPSTNPHPRRILIGTEEHKVRVTSALLPDSPFASTAAPNNQVFIPRLNGGRQLHIEQMEPAWLTGIHGLPKPEQAHLPESHWHKRHTALRALNLTKDLGRPVEMSRPASRTINVESDAFEADPAKPKYIPEPYVPSARRLAANELKPKPTSFDTIRSTKPQSMASENDLDTTERSSQMKACGSGAIHQADIVHQAGVVHQNYSRNDCICASGGDCPHQGSAGNYKEDKSSVEQNRFNRYPKKETHHQGAINQKKSEESDNDDSITLNKDNKFPADEAGHEGSLNQSQFRGSLAEMDQYSFPARGPDHKKPAMSKFKRAPPKPQNKKETSRGGLGEFAFPPRGPGYKRPTVPKVPSIADDEIEITYEDAIAETLAILTRNEIKCTCPPKPTPKTIMTNTATWGGFFGNIMSRKQKQKADTSLEEQNAPKAKHYEGCILCTPPPSPRASDEDITRVAFGLSRQNPGPPPSSPPPLPNLRERSYQAADARRSTLLPAGVLQLETMFTLPDGTEPGPSNHSTLTITSQSIELDHGPYNSQSYHDGHNTSLNHLARPFGRNESTSSSQGGGHTEPELQYNSNLPPSGSTELLTGANIAGNGRGRRLYPHYNAPISRNPDGDQVTESRRGSIFNRRISVIDLESGIRRFSFINHPMLPVDNIIRLPDHANGANIMPEAAEFEMVDLTEPGPPMARLEVSTQSRPRRVMQAMIDFLSTICSTTIFKVQTLWKWFLVQKWAVFLLSFMFCITVAIIA